MTIGRDERRWWADGQVRPSRVDREATLLARHDALLEELDELRASDAELRRQSDHLLAVLAEPWVLGRLGNGLQRPITDHLVELAYDVLKDRMVRAYLSAYRQHGAALRSADGSAWGRDDATRLISARHAHWNPIRWSVADAQRITRSRPDRARWEPDEWQQPAGAVVGRTPIEVADEHAYEVDEDDLCLAAELVGQQWLAPVDTASPYMPGAVALALSRRVRPTEAADRLLARVDPVRFGRHRSLDEDRLDSVGESTIRRWKSRLRTAMAALVALVLGEPS